MGNYKLLIVDIKISQVSTDKYARNLVTYNGMSVTEIRKRIGRVNVVFQKLNRLSSYQEKNREELKNSEISNLL